MVHSNELLKNVSLAPDEEIAASNIKGKNVGITYNEDDDDQDNWNKETKAKLLDDNYDEKLVSFLNKEFVQV